MGVEVAHMGDELAHLGDELAHMGVEVAHIGGEVAHIGDEVAGLNCLTSDLLTRFYRQLKNNLEIETVKYSFQMGGADLYRTL